MGNESWWLSGAPLSHSPFLFCLLVCHTASGQLFDVDWVQRSFLSLSPSRAPGIKFRILYSLLGGLKGGLVGSITFT